MRSIPPDLWLLAVTVGKLQQAMDETPNVMIFQACFDVCKKLEIRLETMRPCASTKIVIYRPNFR